MTGLYNPTLVAASYVVACLAAYCAIYFGTRLFHLSGSARKFWLLAGALCMGSGIWSMHFVGMSAYSMPMHLEMSFSLNHTLASWLPAVLASVLALYIISQAQVSAVKMGASALVMGAGISAMHYGGMAAMHMHPNISYDPTLFGLSIFIAVVASGAALVICRFVRTAPAQHALTIKIAAALIMGVAICGMHYTGMAAAIYDANAIIPSSNLLRGSWMGIPTAIVTALLMIVAISVARQDYRHQDALKLKEKQRQEWVNNAAFIDATTGLINSSRFDQLLIKRIGQDSKFSLFYLQLHNYNTALIAHGEQQVQSWFTVLAQNLNQLCAGNANALLARYSKDSFILTIDIFEQEPLIQLQLQLTDILANNLLTRNGDWHLGISLYPSYATSSRTLINIAKRNKILI